MKAGVEKMQPEKGDLSGNIDSEPVGRISENSIIEKQEEESESKDKTMKKDMDAQKNIRVLIMTDGYQQIVHREVEISAAGGLRIEKKDDLEETAGNEKLRSQKGRCRISKWKDPYTGK